jgi:hypothetical protein
MSQSTTENNSPDQLVQELGVVGWLPFPGRERSWILERNTPAHRFTDVLQSMPNGLFLSLTARDSFNPTLALRLLEVAASHAMSNAIEVFTFLRGIDLGHARFDSLGILTDASHDKFRTENPTLWRQSLVVFPMARFEFAEAEVLSDLRYIRERSVVTIDWDRTPLPRVKMRFANPHTGSRSLGRKRGIASLTSLHLELGNLAGVRDAFVEVENYHGLVATITWADGRYVVRRALGDPESLATLEELLEGVEDFLTA